VQWSGVLALVLASLLWGTTGTTATFLPDDVSPLAVGASTMGIGGALLFLATARRAIGVLRDRTGRRWVALGALGVLVYPLAFYAGMDLAGVAVGNVVARREQVVALRAQYFHCLRVIAGTDGRNE